MLPLLPLVRYECTSSNMPTSINYYMLRVAVPVTLILMKCVFLKQLLTETDMRI